MPLPLLLLLLSRGLSTGAQQVCCLHCDRPRRISSSVSTSRGNAGCCLERTLVLNKVSTCGSMCRRVRYWFVYQKFVDRCLCLFRRSDCGRPRAMRAARASEVSANRQQHRCLSNVKHSTFIAYSLQRPAIDFGGGGGNRARGVCQTAHCETTQRCRQRLQCA